ncbi:uncharacterized protein LOC129928294 isoform X2 [Biomphalaria glabrata]|uniref:Uncharacterized protein LOC129928294 isoform X2 n=1 Tax=Biomphalaria glabrata TaxID=6526 RepID=A0A9W3BF26_BIOGL|nr:uncharacterized protein LOC129928294 isoform X2 [Biomphalaria glabrata]
MAGDCVTGTECTANSNTTAAATNGLPYLILIITLVLCSILLATIALIIIVVVTRYRRKRLDSIEETAISYDDLAKPGLTAMEVQPDMRTLEPRGDPRAYMPYAPLPARRFGPQNQFDDKRRLIPVPEEEGSADEGRQSQEDLFNFPSFDYGSGGNLADNGLGDGNLGDADGEGECDGDSEQALASASSLRHMRQPGYMKGKQRSHSNSGT